MQSFLAEVAADLLQKFGSNLNQQVLVFNNKRPAAYLKKHLAQHLNKAFWSPQFLTIQEFMKACSSYQVADPHTQLFSLYDSYVDILKADAASFIPSIAQFQGVGQVILGDFAQIDMELVDAEKLFTALEDIAVINEKFDFLTQEQQLFLKQFWAAYDAGKHRNMQKNFIQMWQRMPALYKRFYAHLNQQQLSTSAKMYRELAEQLQLSSDINSWPDFIQRSSDKPIIFIGFNALSKAEVQIFRKLQEQGSAIFYFDTDTYYLEDDLQEAGFFIRKNIKQFGLQNQLDNGRSFLKAKSRTLHVYKVQGETAQAKVIPQLLKPYYKEAGLGDTALVLANEDLLIPVLQSIPEQEAGEEICLNVTMGLAFKQSSLYGLVDLWLSNQVNLRKQGYVPDKWVSFKQVQAFATHPLIGISEKLREKILSTLVKEQLQEVAIGRLLPFGGLVEAFFKEVPDLPELIKQLSSLFELIVSRALAAKQLKRLEAHLFISALKELNRLSVQLNQHLSRYEEDALDVGFIASLILKTLQNVSAPLAGEVTSGIQVMGLLESRSLNFKNLFVLGANEGIMPKGSASSSFIPESLRKAYGLPILEFQDAISAYMFYRLVQRAEHIHILYNTQTDEKSSGEKSRFISQLGYESGFKVVEKELQLAVLTESQELLEIPKTPEIMQVLNTYFTSNKSISASAFTGYLQNPIDFFFRYVARIKEPEEVEEDVQANVIGKILHGVMQGFYEALTVSDKTITEEKLAKREGLIEALIEKYTRKEIFKENKSNPAFKGKHKIVMAIVRKYVDIILKEDRKKVPFEIVSLELEYFQPHRFVDKQGKEQQITLRGIFDRIDFKNGIYTIVDYKTGADKLKFGEFADQFNPEEKDINKSLLQTLFYAYIYTCINPGVQVEVSLYVLRNMSKGQVKFEGKNKRLLEGDWLNELRIEFVEGMNAMFMELFDAEVPFKASRKASNYQYSIYKTLFGGI